MGGSRPDPSGALMGLRRRGPGRLDLRQESAPRNVGQDASVWRSLAFCLCFMFKCKCLLLLHLENSSC